MAVVVVSEVAVPAGGDVAQVGGASLRLEVAVDLAGHHRGGGAGVALGQGLRGMTNIFRNIFFFIMQAPYTNIIKVP